MNIYKTFVMRDNRKASLAKREMISQKNELTRICRKLRSFSHKRLAHVSRILLGCNGCNVIVRPDGIYDRNTFIKIWSPTTIYFSPNDCHEFV